MCLTIYGSISLNMVILCKKQAIYLSMTWKLCVAMFQLYNVYCLAKSYICL